MSGTQMEPAAHVTSRLLWQHSCLCLSLLTYVATLTSGDIVAPAPASHFVAPLQNHSVAQGSSVVFTCHLDSSALKVTWVRADTGEVLANVSADSEARMWAWHDNKATWSLHLEDVQPEDSGRYQCALLAAHPPALQTGHLEVRELPDAQRTPPLMLGAHTEVLSVNQGGSLRMRCQASGSPRPKMDWRREDGPNQLHEQATAVPLRTVMGEMLLLGNVQRADSGVYTCTASNGEPPAATKRFVIVVHFAPLVSAATHRVMALLGTDVALRCRVEAAPRANISWFKHSENGRSPLKTAARQRSKSFSSQSGVSNWDGERVVASARHAMGDSRLDETSLLMTLTIRALQPRDLGAYVCAASNKLGRAEDATTLRGERWSLAETVLRLLGGVPWSMSWASASTEMPPTPSPSSSSELPTLRPKGNGGSRPATPTTTTAAPTTAESAPPDGGDHKYKN